MKAPRHLLKWLVAPSFHLSEAFVQEPVGAVPDDHPLAPLIALAREKSPEERRLWLANMRADAPTLVAQLEQLLGVRPDLIPPTTPPPRTEDGGLMRSLLVALMAWPHWPS